MSNSPQSVFIAPKRGLAGIVADCVIDEDHEDTAEITSHPVEYGSPITDNVCNLPATVTLTYGWWMGSDANSDALVDYNAPPSELDGSAGTLPPSQPPFSNYLVNVYKQLLAIKTAASPFAVYTGKRVYQNMLIESLSHRTDKDTENSMIVRIVCKEALIVGTRTFTVATDPTQVSDPQTTLGTTNRGTQQLSSSGTVLADPTYYEDGFQER